MLSMLATHEEEADKDRKPKPYCGAKCCKRTGRIVSYMR